MRVWIEELYCRLARSLAYPPEVRRMMVMALTDQLCMEMNWKKMKENKNV